MRMHNWESSIRLVLAMGVAVPSVLSAQARPVHTLTCDQAARIVAKGHPARKEAEAFAVLASCGAAGAHAIATGMQQYDQETDPQVLQAFMRHADSWRDAEVMDAAIQLATNGGATPAARVFGVRHLVTLVTPYMRFAYAGLVVGSTSVQEPDGTVVTRSGCRGALGAEMADRVGTPLPADYVTRVRQTLAALLASPDTPVEVRNAAQCLP